jgi:uncharacterized membrane protein
MTMVLMFCMTSVVEIKAQEEEVYKAKIVEIKDVKQIEVNGKLQTYQKLVLVGLDGKSNERKIEIENGNLPVVNPIVYEINDKVMIKESSNDGEIIYVIEDTIRTDSLFLLFSIFVTMVVLVSKGRGLLSILSMGVSFGVIFLFILPRIANGDNPVVVATLGALIIIPVIFFLSHGFNSKTTIAILGTVVALAITGVLAQIFIGLAYLYGFSSEESGFLFAENQAIDMSGILLAGIVIGAMGVLDDVAVSQASIVEQLKLSSEKIKRGELFARAMKVGQDHIASMINTLILVYAGASLPLLLIFIDNPRPYSEIVNYEFIAEEIVRTLVGSIGLITAVPVTTLLAAMWFGRKK